MPSQVRILPPALQDVQVVHGKWLVRGQEIAWTDFLYSLGFQDLARLGVLQKQVFNEKFPSNKHRPNLSRNVYRVFTDNDLIKFFQVIKPKEAKFGVAFFLQLTTGLRVGEIPQIKVKDIDFERGIISLITEKANVFSDQPVPFVTLELLQKWIERNKDKIEQSEDYVFFSEYPFSKRNAITSGALRNYFGKFRKRAELESSYATSNDSNNSHQKKNRELNKLTTHSFRRTYLTRLYNDCKNKELVKVLARHKQKEAIDSYLYFDHESQLKLINKVFDRCSFILSCEVLQNI